MIDENKMELAKQVYQTLCKTVEGRGWKYEKDEENMIVYFGINGEDIPMQLILVIDAERQLIRLLSPMPFKMSESKRVEGAIATCAATYGMVDGNFDYDLSDGEIVFRMTASFRESTIGEALFFYMISCSCAMVDTYNDKFLALDKGIIDVTDFLKK